MFLLLRFIPTLFVSLAYSFQSPYYLGAYILRKTNDKKIISKYTYLIINDDDNIKLKTINLNGIVATKVSRTGTINVKKEFNFNLFKSKLVENYDVTVKINNVNKYSYSFCGIEFPEFRYKQIANYNIQKNMKVKQINFTLFITDCDTDYYYIFDIYPFLNVNKQPYVETPMNTFLITQFLGFIINIALVKIFCVFYIQ
jgi:hypothetical protein